MPVRIGSLAAGLLVVGTAWLPPLPSRVVAFDLLFDRFAVDGNVFGARDSVPDLVDDFDDGTLAPNWLRYTGTSSEAGTLLHTASPGGIIQIQGEYVEISNARSAQLVMDGSGSFTADADLLQSLPAVGEVLSISVWNEPTREVFSAALTNHDGLDFVQSVGPQIGNDLQTVDRRFPVDVGGITGPIVLRIVYDDDANTMRAAFSIDGGASFVTPFAPDPIPTPVASMILLSGLAFAPFSSTSTTSTTVAGTSSRTTSTVPFKTTCPENICVCLGGAGRYALIADGRARIYQARNANPTLLADACASRLQVSSFVNFAVTSTRDLFALGVPRGKGVILNGPVFVSGDVATSGGGVFVHPLANVSGAVDVGGNHPGLASCQQAQADAEAASQALGALPPTQHLGSIRESGNLVLSASPGLNVWSASEITLLGGNLFIRLAPDTDAVIINTARLFVRSGNGILGRGIWIVGANDALGADPARVILNVPGTGPPLVARGGLTINPPILAPHRRVKVGVGNVRALFGAAVTAAGAWVEPIGCPP